MTTLVLLVGSKMSAEEMRYTGRVCIVCIVMRCFSSCGTKRQHAQEILEYVNIAVAVEFIEKYTIY